MADEAPTDRDIECPDQEIWSRRDALPSPLHRRHRHTYLSLLPARPTPGSEAPTRTSSTEPSPGIRPLSSPPGRPGPTAPADQRPRWRGHAGRVHLVDHRRRPELCTRSRHQALRDRPGQLRSTGTNNVSFAVPALTPGKVLYATRLTKVNGTWLFQEVVVTAAQTSHGGNVKASAICLGRPRLSVRRR